MYENIIRAVFDEPWAILPSKLNAICELVRLRAAGGHVPQADIDAIVAANPRPLSAAGGAVAVINVFGVIAQRMNLMTAMSGGTSTEQLAAAVRQAVADETVGAIVLNIDSPGGTVYGVEELGNVIYAARGQKPVVAVANSLAASAAYWLASQADEIAVTPSGEVGSIGVIASHIDQSAANDAQGVTVTYITAGKYKAEGNPDEPLSGEAQAFIQGRVNDYYAAFVSAVARGRGVKPAQVRDGMGEGRVVGARAAVQLGMADRVATLEETIARLQSGRRRGGLAASAETEQLITAQAVLSGEPETAREASDSGADLDRRRRRLRLLSHG